MVLAGGYAVWYRRWELAVYDGDLGTDPVIDLMERVRLWFVLTIERVGAQRLALLVLLAVAAVVALPRFARRQLESPPGLETTITLSTPAEPSVAHAHDIPGRRRHGTVTGSSIDSARRMVRTFTRSGHGAHTRTELGAMAAGVLWGHLGNARPERVATSGRHLSGHHP